MTDLEFRGTERAAATLLIHGTPLAWSLEGHYADDGTTLTVHDNADVWAMLSTGERELYGWLEQIAGRRSTVTLHSSGSRLDDDCRKVLTEAFGVFLRVQKVAV